MGIPSMAALSVVMDPSSRESGLEVRLLDAALDVWRLRRLARHRRHAFEQPENAERGLRGNAAFRTRQQVLSACAWTGDIARPNR